MAGIKNKSQADSAKKTPAIQEYLYANLVFWAFLTGTALISFFTCGAVWDDVTSGVVEFLFVVLGGGFTLVSMLDYLYEKYFSSQPLEGKK